MYIFINFAHIRIVIICIARKIDNQLIFYIEFYHFINFIINVHIDHRLFYSYQKIKIDFSSLQNQIRLFLTLIQKMMEIQMPSNYDLYIKLIPMVCIIQFVSNTKYFLKYDQMWNNKNLKNPQCQCSIFSPQNKIFSQKSNKLIQKKKEILPQKNNQKDLAEKKIHKKLILSKPIKNIDKPLEKPVIKQQSIKKELPKFIKKTQFITKTPQKEKIQPIQTNFKEILKIPTFTTKINTKQTPAVIKKTILTSEYFSGLQVRVPQRKLVQFNYQNKQIPNNININRQSSLNDFKKPNQQINRVKDEILKRSQSEKQITNKNRIHIQNIQQKSRIQKTKSVKSVNSVPIKNFQQLRPKSTISSGEDHSEDNNSQYSEVIESHKIIYSHPTYYLDQQI